MKYLVIIILILGLSACAPTKKAYYIFDVTCYSNGTLIFEEKVIARHIHQHRGDTWWRTDEGRILQIHGDCVVKVKGVYYD